MLIADPPPAAATRTGKSFRAVLMAPPPGKTSLLGRGEALFMDLRYALRQTRRSPVSTAFAVITLALGIGAATTVFGVVDAVVLRPLPVTDPSTLVGVRQVSPAACPRCDMMAPGNFLALDETSRTLEVAAARGWAPALQTLDGTEIVRGFRVTPNLPSLVGLPIALGRSFDLAADPGSLRSVLLSHETWSHRFGGDPGVIGRALILGGEPHTVIGVLAPGSGFPPGADVWAPLELGSAAAAERSATDLEVFGRVRAGASLAQTRAELESISASLAAEFPESMAGWHLEPFPIREWRNDAQLPFLLLFVAVTFVLLIACANLAGLLVSRGVARAPEIAIRSALGATRGRLTFLLLTESVALAFAGGVLGALFAVWAIPALHGAIPADLTRSIPGWERIGVNLRVLGCAAMAALVTGVAFGLAPALRGSRGEPAPGIAGGGFRGGSAGRRLRAGLVVAQIAFTMVLTVVTGLVVRSVTNLVSRDPGIETEGVLTMRMRLPQGTADPGSLHGDVVAAVEAMPEIEAAATVNTLPLSHAFSSGGFRVDGRAEPPPGQTPSAGMRVVTPHYFRVMGVPVLKGRSFTEADAAGAPRVAIVNESLVRQFFPEQDPLGHRLRIEEQSYEIVGVVRDVMHRGVMRSVDPEVYRTQAQVPWTDVDLVVRTTGNPDAASPAVREALTRLDPHIATRAARSMGAVAAEALSPFRLLAVTYALLALLSLLISAVGLYGVISNLVAQRTREFGIRMALGASPRNVVWLVVRQGVIMAGGGIALGGAGAFALARFMGMLLHGVSPSDPATFLVTAVVLASVTLMASAAPALHAARVRPASSLRAD